MRTYSLHAPKNSKTSIILKYDHISHIFTSETLDEKLLGPSSITKGEVEKITTEVNSIRDVACFKSSVFFFSQFVNLLVAVVFFASLFYLKSQIDIEETIDEKNGHVSHKNSK